MIFHLREDLHKIQPGGNSRPCLQQPCVARREPIGQLGHRSPGYEGRQWEGDGGNTRHQPVSENKQIPLHGKTPAKHFAFTQPQILAEPTTKLHSCVSHQGRILEQLVQAHGELGGSTCGKPVPNHQWVSCDNHLIDHFYSLLQRHTASKWGRVFCINSQIKVTYAQTHISLNVPSDVNRVDHFSEKIANL